MIIIDVYTAKSVLFWQGGALGIKTDGMAVRNTFTY
jgi:hypothetical protein